jgi:DNA-binding response OmpR family regulator
MAHILSVDDDEKLGKLLRDGLEAIGHRVWLAGSGAEALKSIASSPPDVVLLDFELPDLNGTELCRHIREGGVVERARVIMLTARADEASRIQAFEAGADDYVTKPFSFRELGLRIRAVTEPPPTPRPSRLVAGRISIDTVGLRARVDGIPVDLSASEFALLCAICRQPQRLLSRNHLASQVWGAGVGVEEKALDGLMRRLRAKLGSAGCCIRIVRGEGYRFEVTL